MTNLVRGSLHNCVILSRLWVVLVGNRVVLLNKRLVETSNRIIQRPSQQNTTVAEELTPEPVTGTNNPLNSGMGAIDFPLCV